MSPQPERGQLINHTNKCGNSEINSDGERLTGGGPQGSLLGSVGFIILAGCTFLSNKFKVVNALRRKAVLQMFMSKCVVPVPPPPTPPPASRSSVSSSFHVFLLTSVISSDNGSKADAGRHQLTGDSACHRLALCARSSFCLTHISCSKGKLFSTSIASF